MFRDEKKRKRCYLNQLRACYLYVEGSGAGDHLKQVVPHHQLTAEYSTGRAQQQYLMTCDVMPRIDPRAWTAAHIRLLTGKVTDLCLHS